MGRRPLIGSAEPCWLRLTGSLANSYHPCDNVSSKTTVTRWEEKTVADQAMVKELIRGAYDMHIHSAPDVLPRKFNDIVLAEHAVEAGMAGVVLKSHYICTADRANLINEMFPALYAEQGLELLRMFPEGEVCMTTQEPVKTPEDLNEVKFRVMTNPLLVESYKAFGATPTPLPWGEVYGAMQTGIIQGQENPGFYLESTKMYEVTDVITCIGHNNFTTAVMANKDFYDGLSDEDKEVVENASDAAFDYILEYQSGLQEKSLENIAAAKPDMQINILSEEERQPFKDKAASVEEAFIEMTGDSGKEILEQFKADLEAVK
jgi:hypothetical protein